MGEFMKRIKQQKMHINHGISERKNRKKRVTKKNKEI